MFVRSENMYFSHRFNSKVKIIKEIFYVNMCICTLEHNKNLLTLFGPMECSIKFDTVE